MKKTQQQLTTSDETTKEKKNKFDGLNEKYESCGFGSVYQKAISMTLKLAKKEKQVAVVLMTSLYVIDQSNNENIDHPHCDI